MSMCMHVHVCYVGREAWGELRRALRMHNILSGYHMAGEQSDLHSLAYGSTL